MYTHTYTCMLMHKNEKAGDTHRQSSAQTNTHACLPYVLDCVMRDRNRDSKGRVMASGRSAACEAVYATDGAYGT